jgi:hypothetical protein
MSVGCILLPCSGVAFKSHMSIKMMCLHGHGMLVNRPSSDGAISQKNEDLICIFVVHMSNFYNLLLFCFQVGLNQMHSMCALHHTNWSSRIIKVLGVKSGSTSFWMKHRILRTSSHRGGSCCSIFKHRGNVFVTELLKGWIFKLWHM